MSESGEEKNYLNPRISIANLADGQFHKNQLGQTNSKFKGLIKNEIAHSNAAMVTHLMNGLIMLIDEPEEMLEVLLENKTYSELAPEASEGTGVKISLTDDGVQKYTTLALYAIQVIAEREKVELNEESLKLVFRALMGYSIKWVESQPRTLDISTHFSGYLLPDVVARIENQSNDSEE